MIIKKIKVLNPSWISTIANVHIATRKITNVEAAKGPAETILIPGFIDIHIHCLKGYDIMDGSQALQIISKELTQYGTTSFVPTLMTVVFSKILTTLHTLSNTPSRGSNIIGLHLEEPFNVPAKGGAHDEKFLLKPTRAMVEKLWAAANYQLKKIVLAPEVVDPKIVNYFTTKKVIVAIGHSNARGQLVDSFVKAGVSSCANLWNAMGGVENRNPGIAEIVLATPQINAELICGFVHVNRKTLKLSIDVKTPDHILAIIDAIRLAKTNDVTSLSGDLEIIRNGNVLRAKKSGAIAGGGSTMHENFKNIIKLGYSLSDAVKMTSFNQAREFKLNKGLIKAGYDADLLVLEENYESNYCWQLRPIITCSS